MISAASAVSAVETKDLNLASITIAEMRLPVNGVSRSEPRLGELHPDRKEKPQRAIKICYEAISCNTLRPAA